MGFGMDYSRPSRRKVISWGVSLAMWGVLFALLVLVEVGVIVQTGRLWASDMTAAGGFLFVVVSAGAMVVYSARNYILARREVEILQGPWTAAKTR